MSVAFLELPANDRIDILEAGSRLLGRRPQILEKDVWVCWALARLFSMPDRAAMAFKGGTSLSKVYGVIDRFSEDIDLTLDYRTLVSDLDPFAPGISKNQMKKISEKLKAAVREHSHERIVPFLQSALDYAGHQGTIEVSDDGEQVRLHYPSALGVYGGYVSESVLLEFGGRNITEPNERRRIRPYLDDCFLQVEFEATSVDVLSPIRTFWEKATLAHAECNRNEFRVGAQRLSRHWYDLFRLADHQIGQEALQNRALLADVVKHKQVFYNSSFARYEACLEGGLLLVPKEEVLASFKRDYDEMNSAGMLPDDAPSFDHIMERLMSLEEEINSASKEA